MPILVSAVVDNPPPPSTVHVWSQSTPVTHDDEVTGSGRNDRIPATTGGLPPVVSLSTWRQDGLYSPPVEHSASMKDAVATTTTTTTTTSAWDLQMGSIANHRLGGELVAVPTLFPGTSRASEQPNLRKVMGDSGGGGSTTTNTKKNENKNKDCKDNVAMRKIKSIKQGFLTPPKKDTERIFNIPPRHPPRPLLPSSSSSYYYYDSPPSLMSVNGWGSDAVDVSSTFEMMITPNGKQHNMRGGVGGGRVHSMKETFNKFTAIHNVGRGGGGHDLAGTYTLSTVASSTNQLSTVASLATNNQQSSISLPRGAQNLTSLFESSIEDDYDDDYNNNDNSNDDMNNNNADIIGDISYRDVGPGSGSRSENDVDALLLATGAEEDQLPLLSNHSSLSSCSKPDNNIGGVFSLLKRRSSSGGKKVLEIPSPTTPGGRHNLPHTPSSQSRGVNNNNNKNDGGGGGGVLPRVPQYIHRHDGDDVSKTSTLTEPDFRRRVVLRASNIRAQSSPNSVVKGLDAIFASVANNADGVTTTLASSVMDSLGTSHVGTGDKLWNSVFNVLDDALQCLPTCNREEVDGGVSLHLEEEEKFALNFQNELMKTGVRLIYHECPTTAESTDWVQSTVKLFLRPGNCQGAHPLRQPSLLWAALPVVSRMKVSVVDLDIISPFNNEKGWNMLSLMDVHSILCDEGDRGEDVGGGGQGRASSFFSITSSNGAVYVFEAPSSEARYYVVRGLRLVISRLTYRMIVGDATIIKELFSSEDAAAQRTGDLPSLTKPWKGLSNVVHDLLDQQ